MSANDQEKRLSARQERAIAALLGGLTRGQAAAAAGVVPRTLSRWIADDAFRAALAEASDQALDDAARRLVGALDRAITVLVGIMSDPGERPAARLRAAELVIGRGLDLVELRELAGRVAALEEKLIAHENNDW